MEFVDMLSQEEQLVLAREGDDDMAAAQAADLEARRQRVEAILAKLERHHCLWKDEIDTLRYEYGLDIH